MLVVVCGVSGAGKTTVGRLLSQALELPFFDADEFHSASSVEKMKCAVPLSEEDRIPWLESLANNLAAWEKEGGAVLACSALKESYREILGSRVGDKIMWVFLHGPKDLLSDRLSSRRGHFFDRRLLESQLSALEFPDYGLPIEVTSPPEVIVSNIIEKLRSK